MSFEEIVDDTRHTTDVGHRRITTAQANKRTMMVLYRSPEQTDLNTYYLSFSQVHCSKIFVKIL